MEYWIMSANRKIYDHQSAFKELGIIDWRDSKRKFKVGDIIYIYSTRPISSIEYKCQVIKTKVSFDKKIDDHKFWKQGFVEQDSSRTYVRIKLISYLNKEELNLEKLKLNGLKAAPQGPSRISKQLLSYLDEVLKDDTIFVEDGESYYEGNRTKVLTTKYERNPNARKECLDYHGYTCKVCDFNFESTYGALGKGFIHVHHIIPVHTIKRVYKIDPINDLVPVCPNCHSMLHMKNNKDDFFSVEELRNIIK